MPDGWVPKNTSELDTGSIFWQLLVEFFFEKFDFFRFREFYHLSKIDVVSSGLSPHHLCACVYLVLLLLWVYLPDPINTLVKSIHKVHKIRAMEPRIIDWGWRSTSNAVAESSLMPHDITRSLLEEKPSFLRMSSHQKSKSVYEIQFFLSVSLAAFFYQYTQVPSPINKNYATDKHRYRYLPKTIP